MGQGTRLRVYVGYALVVVAALAFVVLRIGESRVHRDRSLEESTGYARLIAEAARAGVDFDDEKTVEDAFRGVLLDPALLYVRVLDAGGRVIAGRAGEGVTPAWAGTPPASTVRIVESGRIEISEPIHTRVGERIGAAQIAFSTRTVTRRRRAVDAVSGSVLIALLMGGVLVLRGVRQRARIEAMVQSDRLASIGRLAASVAHEINNPLAFMSTNVDFARRAMPEVLGGDKELASEVGDALKDAADGAERVRKIVGDLKSFARSSDDALAQPVELDAIAQQAAKMVGRQVSARGTLAVETGGAPLVIASEGRLSQVVVNLLVNAAQALPESSADRNRVVVRTGLEKGRAFLEVTDTGCGIPPDVRRRIFEPFFTTKPQGVGTGLGLFVCHQIVSSYGGTILVDSEIGKGTTFRIELPPASAAAIAAADARRTAAAPKVARIAGQRLRILLVDDEAALTGALRRDLAMEHDVSTVNDGAKAIDLLERDDSRFDAVVCDLMMPGTPGWEVFQQVKKTRPDVAERFIFMTGGTFTENGREFVERVGNARLLHKPFRVDVLDYAVRELVRQHGTAGGASA